MPLFRRATGGGGSVDAGALAALGVGITSPLDISGCQLWLDASDAITINAGSPANNDPVSTWADKSGNDFDATQTDAGSRPLFQTAIVNGFNAIHFDSELAAVPKWLVLSGSALAMLKAGAGATIGVVLANVPGTTPVQAMAILTDSGNSRRAFVGVTPNIDGYLIRANAGFSNSDNDDIPLYISQTIVNPCKSVVVTAVVRVSSAELAADTSCQLLDPVVTNTITAGNFPNTNASAIHIGGDNTEPGAAILDGDLCELVIWNRPITARELRNWREYATTKWGIL